MANLKLKETGPNGIEARVKKYARAKGCHVRKFSSPANQGVPDDIFITPTGKVFFIEFKSPGRKPTRKQEHELNQILQRGAKAYVIDGIVSGLGANLWHKDFPIDIEIWHDGYKLIDKIISVRLMDKILSANG